MRRFSCTIDFSLVFMLLELLGRVAPFRFYVLP
nr:MAG TPA: hypothetical protein [Caudoviricetes sp.]